MRRFFLLIVVLIGLTACSGQPTPEAQVAARKVPTQTPWIVMVIVTATPTHTPTPLPTSTPSVTPAETGTPTATSTATDPPTWTPVPIDLSATATLPMPYTPQPPSTPTPTVVSVSTPVSLEVIGVQHDVGGVAVASVAERDACVFNAYSISEHRLRINEDMLIGCKQ